MLVFGVHLWSEKREWPHVIVFKMYLVVSRWLVFFLGFVSMPAPDDGFTRRLKHLLRFGQ